MNYFFPNRSNLSTRAVSRGLCALLGLSMTMLAACNDAAMTSGEQVSGYHRERALKSLDAGDYEQALIASELVTRYDANNPDSHDLALRVRLTAIANEPEGITIQYPARVLYEAAFMAERDPERAATYRTAQGQIAIAQKDYGTARAAFEAAIELNGQSVRAHEGLVRVLMNQGESEAALGAMEHALAAGIKDSQMWVSFADVMLRLNKVERALALMRELVKHEESASNHVHLAKTLQAVERKQEAGAHFETAARLAPSNASVQTLFADWLLAANQFDDADKVYDGVIKLGGLDRGHFGKGMIRMKREDYQGASEHFGKVAEADPNARGAMYYAGRSHEAIGEADAARQWYQRYVKSTAESPTPNPVLGDVKRRLAALQGASVGQGGMTIQ